MTAMTSQQIVSLLKQRHSDDVFVPECKNGPSAGMEHLRMDAWAMAKSWTRPMTWGYEIKVSRADFLADQKMSEYMRYCSQFYVVCPKGVAAIEEIPEGAGLLQAVGTGTGARLVSVRKAQVRNVVIPERLFRYILMSRARIDDAPERDRARYWREWLDEKEEYRHLASRVSSAIHAYVRKVEDENRELIERNGRYECIREALEQMGWKEPDKHWISAHLVKAKLEEHVPQSLMNHIAWARRSLEQVEKSLTEIREGGKS